jgi:polyphosphate kinase
VTHNSNLYLEEKESRSLLDSVDTQLHRRRKGAAVRMEIEAGANREIVDRLQANFRLEPWQMFHVNGPPNLSRLFHMYDQTPRPDLKFKPFVSRELALKKGASSIFESIRKRSVLLHHPYDSYSAVVRFIESAAQDPDVLSIKQTLYRTSENSPIVRALIDAAAKTELAGSRRASVSRSCGAEDALQTGTCGTTGIEWTDSPVCASGHRELQPFDRALLYGFEPIDDGSAHHRVRAPRV